MYTYYDVDVGTGCSWVELPVQRRLCPIFVSSVGLPDIHEYSAGCQRIPGFGASHELMFD